MTSVNVKQDDVSQRRYLFGLNAIDTLAFAILATCLLAPLTLLSAPSPPLLRAVPMFVILCIGLAMPLTALRWIGPGIFGAKAMRAVLPIVSVAMLLVYVGTLTLVIVNPAGLKYAVLPNLLFVFGSLALMDVTLRGFIHGWMQRVGFGRTFRLLVPAALVFCIVHPIAVTMDSTLTIAVVASSLLGGVVRHTSASALWLIATPVSILATLFLATL